MEWLTPDWPAPKRVRAAITTRQGGVSSAPYDSLNLGDHVEDSPEAVARNRQILIDSLGLPCEPHWLSQVHGCKVVQTDQAPRGCQADAVCATEAGAVCAVCSLPAVVEVDVLVSQAVVAKARIKIRIRIVSLFMFGTFSS